LLAGEGYFGLPAASATVLDEALASGEAPVCIKHAEAAMLAFWRMARDSEALSALAECGGGVAGRLHSCAVKAASAEEFFALAATKKYTNARLRRAALFGLTGVTYADLDALPAYLNLLAVNKNGRAFISAAKRRGGIEIVTKPSRIPDTAAARRQSELARNLDAIYTLAMPKKRENGFFLTKSPIITEIS
jgi:predicted nucleotidyltransferase